MLTVKDVLNRIMQESARLKSTENLDHVKFIVYVDEGSYNDLKHNSSNMPPEAVSAFGLLEDNGIPRIAGHRIFVVKTSGFHLNICRST